MRNTIFFIGSLLFAWMFAVIINGGTAGNASDVFSVNSGFSLFRASAGRIALPESPVLTAKSAVLLEANSNRIIFEKNPHEIRPSASLTKIFTGIIAYEQYSPRSLVRISEDAYRANGSRFQKFKTGEAYTVEQLLHVLLIESSNTAAYALSSLLGNEAFVARMNEKAKILGFSKTSLFGPSGIDEEGSKTSAWEIAKIGEYLLYNETLGEIMRKGTYMLYDAHGNFKRKVFTTNELWGIEGLVAAKTGFTDEAQGNLLLVITHPIKPDEFVISVVMGSEDRAGDTLKLLNLIR